MQPDNTTPAARIPNFAISDDIASLPIPRSRRNDAPQTP
jgi:hypothetical protein